MKYIRFTLFLCILSFHLASHGSVACLYIFDLTAEKTTVENLKPTQMEYGFESIARRLSRMESEALATGMSLSDYIQKHFLKNFIPVVKSPKGEYFVTDSHHGIHLILNGTKNPNEIPIYLKVLKDYTQPKDNKTPWTYSEFIRDLQKPVSEGGMGKAWYTKKVRTLDPVERFKYLPESFTSMKDTPIRALVGESLSRYGVKKRYLKDYIEFQLIDILESRYPEVSQLKFSDKNVDLVASILFHSHEIIMFLMQNPKNPELTKQNIESLEKAKQNFLLQN
ncbi:MAG: hypothetical protein MK008_14615 [Bdellovibrionales bacterium]|nr:hypothetical protein [Bdellovibrionales bacterium]